MQESIVNCYDRSKICSNADKSITFSNDLKPVYKSCKSIYFEPILAQFFKYSSLFIWSILDDDTGKYLQIVLIIVEDIIRCDFLSWVGVKLSFNILFCFNSISNCRWNLVFYIVWLGLILSGILIWFIFFEGLELVPLLFRVEFKRLESNLS